MMRAVKISFYLVAAILLGLLLWAGYLWYYFYTNTYQGVLNGYLEAHPNIYRHHLFAKQLFTPQTFREALVWLLVSFNILYLLKAVWWRYNSSIKRAIGLTISELKEVFKKMLLSWQYQTTTQKKMMMGLTVFVLIHQIYMYFSIFVAMDEAFSWLYFSTQGTKVTLTHYPVPNNHVFYNLCSSFWEIFIADDILAMRMTTLLSFWALWGLCCAYLSRKTSFVTTFVSLAIIGLGFSQSVFAVQARGYMLCAFLMVLALFCLLEYLRERTKIYLYAFTAACMLGFFTIPVFLYAMVSFYAYLLWEYFQKRHLDTFKTFFVVGLLVVGCVLVFYTPILVYSGRGALLGNENVSPKDYNAHWFFTYILPISFRESIIYVFSLPKYVSFMAALLVTGGGIYLFRNREKFQLPDFYGNFWRFLLISLPTIGLIICVMQAFPFYRVWTFYAIFLAILLGLIAGHFIKQKVNLQLTVFVCSVFGLSFLQFQREIQDFYDPKALENHLKLEAQIKGVIDNKQQIFISEEAFYIRFWLKYFKAEDLQKTNPCRADVAVQEIPETSPTCQKPAKDIWFLRFYERSDEK